MVTVVRKDRPTTPDVRADRPSGDDNAATPTKDKGSRRRWLVRGTVAVAGVISLAGAIQAEKPVVPNQSTPATPSELRHTDSGLLSDARNLEFPESPRELIKRWDFASRNERMLIATAIRMQRAEALPALRVAVLSGTESQKMMAEVGVIPTLSGLIGDPAMPDYFDVFLTQLETAQARVPHPSWSDMDGAINNAFQRMLRDEQSPQEALDQAAAEINALLG